MSEIRNKAAIYCRLSAEDRDKSSPEEDSRSIQNQKSMLVQYAIKNGWEIYNIYSDDDYTGSDRNRPEFNKLLKDAEQGRFHILLCKTQSRFTRELELVEKYIHGLFTVWGIRFVSLVDNADTANEGNKKSRQINGLVNEWYLEDLSDNIKGVLTDRRKNGKHIGAFALYGYRKDPDEKGHLIIDEEAAKVVREVFLLYASGYGKTQIARILNERGIPNPTEYKRLKGMRYKAPKSNAATLWKYFAIGAMLTNEMYIGNMVQGKQESISYKTQVKKSRPKEKWYIVKNTHAPIIDRELWNRVQEQIKEHAKPVANGKTGIFAKKTKCMYCGYHMRSKKNHNKYYLECPTKYSLKSACQGAFISQQVLENVLIEEITILTKNYFNMDKAESMLHIQSEDYFNKAECAKKEIQMLQTKITELMDAKSNLYLDKTKGIVNDNDYVELSSGFAKKQQFYESCIKKQEIYISKLLHVQEDCQSKKQIISKYVGLTKLNRHIINTLIDYIEIGKRLDRNEQYPIKIHWKF